MVVTLENGEPYGSDNWLGRAGDAVSHRRREQKGLPTHPSELKYPCCNHALGEFLKMTPRGESAFSLGHRPRRHQYARIGAGIPLSAVSY